jgi:hypothetical protein
MKRYTVVIYWRAFSWTLRAWAAKPSDLRGLVADFGGEHPVTLKLAVVN